MNTIDCGDCGRRYDPLDWDGETPCPSDDCPSHELAMSPTLLEFLYSPDGDGEHPKYTRAQWREQVYHQYTISGYWDWVEHMLLGE